MRLRARRTVGLTVAAAGALVVAVSAGPPDARATTAMPSAGTGTETFAASAAADAVRISLAVPDFLVIEKFVDGGGPSAQAQADSVGSSSGFASFPYPGDTAVTLPGLLGILTGQSLPTYPLYGSSNYPTVPSYKVDQPGYHLSSVSDENGTTASAQLGEQTTTAGEGGLFSTASAGRLANGDVRAVGNSRGGFSLGSVQMRGFEATAELVRRVDGTSAKSSDLRFASFSVAGVPISVTDKGLVIGESGLIPALPVGTPLQSFSHEGTTVTYLAGSVTDDSVVSPGLRITTSQQLPNVGRPLNLAYTLGQASASAVASGAETGTPAGGPTTSADAGSALPPAAGIDGAGLLPPLAPGTQTGAVPGRNGAPTAFTPTFLGAPKALPSLSFYPVLFFLALAGAAAAARSRRERT